MTVDDGAHLFVPIAANDCDQELMIMMMITKHCIYCVR